VRQSSQSKTGSSLLLLQPLVAHIFEQHGALKNKKKTIPLLKALIIQFILRLYQQLFGVKKPTTFIFAVGEIYPQSSEKEEEDKETDLCIVQELKNSLFNFYTTFNYNNLVQRPHTYKYCL